MKVQYDFDEGIMNQNFPKINIPTLMSYSNTMQSSRNSTPLLMDIEKIMQEEKSREQKRIHQLKQKQHHISQHVERTLAQKQRKIRALQQQQKRKIYEQCTFKPKIQAKTEKRTLDQFLSQQKQFVKKINDKKNNLKANLQSQNNKNTFHPKINNPKRKTNDPNKAKDTVFQRLYALKDKQNTENINLQENQEQFQPKITQKSKKLARNMPIDDLLYNDALRRQQKSKDIQNINSNPVQYKSQKLNLNNEKYVAQKFIKEYFNIIQKLEVPSSTSARIEYVMFNEILKQMGFVGIEEEGQNNKERSLIHQAYQLLEKYQVNAKNICVFLLAIIGVYHINPINFQEGDIVDLEKDFAVDQPDGRKLQKYFDLFKRNRLFGESLRRQFEKQMSEPQEHSYHPKINKLSSQLAEKYRDQMLQDANKLLESYPQIQFSIPEDGMINHTDLLVLNNLANQIKRQNKKQQLDRKQMDSCTFKPITSPNSLAQTMFNSKMSNKQIASIGQKKSLELYNFHKNLQNKKQSLKASRNSQDQLLKQCTFAPKINNKKVQNDLKNFQTKEIDQAIYRMKKGRDMTQEKKRFLQRGEKKSRNDKEVLKFKEKIDKSVEIEQTPTLLLDVNLGQSIDRIVIYPGDQNRLQQLAKEFAHKHGLDSQNEQKLYELLKIELESVLMKIEEDEEIQNQNQQQ